MKRFLVISLASFILIFCAQIAEAKKVYVRDLIEITLRTGPSFENKIIGIFRTGEPLEILEINEKWTRVKSLKEGHESMEGWVLGRYLMDRVPWELQVAGLKKVNTRIKEKNAEMKKTIEEVSERERLLLSEHRSAMNELNRIKSGYEELKKSSTKYLSLKKAHDEAIASLESIKKKNAELESRNKELGSNKNIKWFGTGAIILFLGLIMGIVLGRKDKKRKSLYY
jgi:SH3 domain protein